MATINDIKALIESIENKQTDMFKIFKEEINEIKYKILKKEGDSHSLSDFDSVKLKVIMKDFLKNESVELFAPEREKISKLDESFKALNSKIDKLIERVDKLENSKKSDYLENKINSFIEQFDKKINNMIILINGNKNENFHHENSVNENNFSEKIVLIDNEVNSIKTKIDDITNNETIFKEKIESIENKLSVIDSLDEKFSSIKKEISDIEGYVLKTWVTDEDLLKFTEDLESKIIPKDTLLEIIENKILSVNDRIDKNEKNISLISSSVELIYSKISKFDVKSGSEKFVLVSDFETELQYLKHRISDSTTLKKDIEESLSYLKIRMENRITKEQLNEIKKDFEKKIENINDELQLVLKTKTDSINKNSNNNDIEKEKTVVVIQNFFS